MLRKFIIPPIFILLFFVELRAQYDNIRFSGLTTDDGLSDNGVIYIFQDSKGFMWFATVSGLNRYDGYNFKKYTFDPERDGSISDNVITRIYEDREGALWFGTLSGGLNRYDRIHDSFRAYKNDPGDPKSIASNHIQVLFEDSKGNFWVGVKDKGVNKLDRKTGMFTRDYIPLRRPDGYGTVVWVICEDKFGNLWMGASGNGIYMLNSTTGKLSNFLDHPEDSSDVSDDKVRCMHLDKDQNLWIGTWNGMKKLSLAEFYQTGEVKFKRFKTKGIGLNDNGSSSLTEICEDSNGMLWVGTDGGLALFDRKSEQFTVFKYSDNESNGLLGTSIWTIFRDKSDVMWIATPGGINIYDNKRNRFNVFWYKPGLSNSVYFDMLSYPQEDREGNFWFVSSGQSISIWNKSNNTLKTRFPEFISDKEAASYIHIDSKYRFWLSVIGRTILLSEVIEFDPVTLNLKRKFSISATGINEDKKGLLWFNSWHGLYTLDPEKNLVRNLPINNEYYPSNADQNNVMLTYEDNDNNMWIKTGTAFFMMDKKTEKSFQYTSTGNDTGTKSRISSENVTSIYDDKNGNIWLTTYGGGLNKFDKKSTFTHIDKDSGFVDDFMSSLLTDGHGNFWIGSNSGLSKYNPVDGTIKNYGIEDGLQGRELTFPAFKSSTGEMFFGGSNGLNYFYPDSIRDNPIVPPVVITKFMVFDKEIKLDTSILYKKEIMLPFDSNFFSIEFTALSYTNPSKNMYKYMLEGVDKDWIKADASGRRANYTDINPGEYVFRVKGSNNDGVWNEEGTSIKIVITPPWWQTWWFRGCGFIFVIGILAYSRHRKLSIIRKEMQQKEVFTKQLINTQEAERKRIAGELHDSLGQNLLVIKNKLLLKIQNENSRDMDDISELTSKAIEEVRSISHNLIPYEIDRLGLTEAIESIIDNIMNSTNITIKHDIENVDNMLSKENEINFYRIVQECMTNIVKHSLAKDAEIKIKRPGGVIEVSISDNGIGFDMEKLKSRKGSMGLTGIQERVNILNGQLMIYSNPGKGTQIKITLNTQFK